MSSDRSNVSHHIRPSSWLNDEIFILEIANATPSGESVSFFPEIEYMAGQLKFRPGSWLNDEIFILEIANATPSGESVSCYPEIDLMDGQLKRTGGGVLFCRQVIVWAGDE